MLTEGRTLETLFGEYAVKTINKTI